MSSTLALLLVLLVIALIWLDGARAREFATILARRYCANRGMQLLDDTVSLARLGLRWTRQGLRVRRMFRFEFSLEGVGRRTGYVLMLGSRLETIDDGLPRTAEPEAEAPRPAAGDERKVIPFRRRDR